MKIDIRSEALGSKWKRNDSRSKMKNDSRSSTQGSKYKRIDFRS